MKLIAFDFDGTLVSRWGGVTPFAKHHLKVFQDQGLEVFVVTGRSYYSIYKALDSAGLRLGIISNNGNMLRDMRKMERAYSRPLDKTLVEEVLRVLEAHDLDPILHIDGWGGEADLLLTREPRNFKNTSYVASYDGRYRILEPGDLAKEEVLSIALYIREEAYLPLKEEIARLFPQVQTHLLSRGFGPSRLMEVVGEGTSKWSALRSYAQARGIGPEEIIAVGDDTNDLEMVKEAGLGIAMVDGHQEIIDQADLVTKRPAEEDGAIRTVLDYLGLQAEEVEDL